MPCNQKCDQGRNCQCDFSPYVLRAIADNKRVRYAKSIGDRWIVYTLGDTVNPLSHPEYKWEVAPEPKPSAYSYLEIWQPPDAVIAAKHAPNIFPGADLRIDWEWDEAKQKYRAIGFRNLK